MKQPKLRFGMPEDLPEGFEPPKADINKIEILIRQIHDQIDLDTKNLDRKEKIREYGIWASALHNAHREVVYKLVEDDLIMVLQFLTQAHFLDIMNIHKRIQMMRDEIDQEEKS